MTEAAGTVSAVVFDVNETLSDLSPLSGLLEAAGAPGTLLDAWFAGVLRDGFALTAAGAYADFSDVASAVLADLLSGLPRPPEDPRAAARRVVEGFGELRVHPDVPEGVRRLRAGGLRLATLTNGSVATTERLLDRAGLLDCFDMLLDVSGPGCWKPAAGAYHHAVERLGVRPAEAVLVAVHPWDVDGAQRAGLRGAWLRRGARLYPPVMTAPAWSAEDLPALARQLTSA